MGTRITRFWELEVYQVAFKVAMKIFELSKKFPVDERYSLTDQIRRCSRSVTAQISEAWHKRRYKLAFVSKLNDSESEAGETQNWLFYAKACGYVEKEVMDELVKEYDHIIGMLVNMMNNPDEWLIRK